MDWEHLVGLEGRAEVHVREAEEPEVCWGGGVVPPHVFPQH